jgi:hypothetical protein
MLNAEFLHQTWWENTRRECTSENLTELGVQTTDTHIFELEVGG